MTLDEQKNSDGSYEGHPKIDLVFNAVYHNNDPNHENSKFWEWTPSGQLILSTVNKAVLEELEPGKEYYIDIIPVNFPMPPSTAG